MIRTAIDTNIVSALWSREPLVATVTQIFDQASADGVLIMSAPVFAELMGHKNITLGKLQAFVTSMRIEADFDLDEDVWIKAGSAYGDYTIRRRRSGGGEAKGLLADFLIGAHASLRADRLLTEDVSRYKRAFPDLELLTVSK